LRLYNTRTHATETFVPAQAGHVRIYVCGLTPSAEAHLGHARSFMFFDVLRRYLVHLGYRVTFVQNVTDIDDRSIEAARESGGDWRAIVNGYYESFKRSMERLYVLEPDREPRATAYIAEICRLIGDLIAGGHAYVVGDGVYFKVRSFPRYGALSGRNLDELLIGARIAPDEAKEDPLDFALWKFAKPGEPSWPSPWGDGRPGWHIECSAMAHALLGEPVDIHGGGYDLIFPHHENEIAQSESIFPPPFVNFWLHGGLLQFDGRKMSKSLGNFEPLSSLLDRHDPQAIRLLFLQTGYRKPMNFTEEGIAGAASGLRRLLAAYDALRVAPPDAAATHAWLEPYTARFYAALDDDMNTAGAVSVLFDLANATADAQTAGAAPAAAAFLHEALGLLGISPLQRTPVRETGPGASRDLELNGAALTLTAPPDADARLPGDVVERLRASLGADAPLDGEGKSAAVEAVIVARLRAKAVRDFASADKYRDALRAVGVSVTDLKDGATWNVVD
jgi:cysteinyl-tRNA synthetase